MKWNEVKVETASEAVEAVANILMEAGASGVAIEDALDVENFKSDQYGEILNKEDFTSNSQNLAWRSVKISSPLVKWKKATGQLLGKSIITQYGSPEC